MNDSTTLHPSANFTVAAVWTIEIPEMFMLSFSFVFGLPIHAYVLYLIGKSGIASEFLNFNRSICEIFFSFNSLMLLLAKWFLSLVPLSQFLLGLGITGRPLFQCLICVERYLAVVYPVIFLKYKPLRYRLMCSAVTWIMSFVSCVMCLLLLNFFSSFSYLWYDCVQFLLYLSIKMFCLLAVLRALKQSGPGERGRERGREREEENHMKKKAFLFILSTTVGMFVTYVPFTTTGFFIIVTRNSVQALWTFSFICFMLAGFVQPILYLQRTKKIGQSTNR